ncbi:hypothetical protein EXIGLDRAFT_749602 [Exidia glandulosa HHB12029]|uniref:F-box domain-containing protein n=1 Tax=Exidia glandulosa HHB12029 TaxID=1314781 RepID=A0A165HWC9_EXIGL|nr:hypothetical protein EXIGLDRAFT_749602 [Exidia glandulosa HHB12029]
MTSAGDCPGEILLDIFDRVAERNPDTYRRVEPWDRSDFYAYRTRIDALLACARVCKGWAPFAQLMIYRDVHVVVFHEQDLAHDPYRGERRAQSDLVRALQRSPLLGSNVQSLQMSLLQRRDNVISDLVVLLALLPNLVHFDLTVDAKDLIKPFAETDIASLSRSSQVRYLALRSTPGGVQLDIYNQLLRMFPSVEVLTLTFHLTDEVYSGAVDRAWAAGVLPNLRDIRSARCVNARAFVLIPLLQHAPNLQSLALTEVWKEEHIDSIPRGLQHLVLHNAWWTFDVTRLTSLKTLVMIGNEPPDTAILGCLRIASPTLEELALSVDVLESAQLVEEIENIIHQRFPALSRVYIEMLEGYNLNLVLRHGSSVKDMIQRIGEHLPGIFITLTPESHFDQFKAPYAEVQRLRIVKG